MLFTFANFIYRAVWSTLIKLPFHYDDKLRCFESFCYDVAMSIAYIVCFVAKLAFNLICTLYFASGVRKIDPRSGSGFGLGLALELGLGGNFCRGQFF